MDEKGGRGKASEVTTWKFSKNSFKESKPNPNNNNNATN